MPRLYNLMPDSIVEPLLSAHLKHLEQRNHSQRTVRERRFAVLRVARFLGHPVQFITRDELRTWQAANSYLTPGGMHGAIVHLAQFLHWMAVEEHRQDDPSVVLVRPRGFHTHLPRPMADPTIYKALEAATHPVFIWLSLGAFCGLRCMEMAGLSREHLIPGLKPYLRITGKGSKVRIVPCPVNVLELLQSDQVNRRGFLFSRMDGKPGPPSATRVSERINHHLHSLGIPDTAHALRHRFGTKLYEETHDLLLVSRVMGHSSMNTTQDYVDIVNLAAAQPIENISRLALPLAA